MDVIVVEPRMFAIHVFQPKSVICLECCNSSEVAVAKLPERLTRCSVNALEESSVIVDHHCIATWTRMVESNLDHGK